MEKDISIQEKMWNFRYKYLTLNQGIEPECGFFAALSRNDFYKLVRDGRYLTVKFEENEFKRYFINFLLDSEDEIEDGKPILGVENPFLGVIK